MEEFGLLVAVAMTNNDAVRLCCDNLTLPDVSDEDLTYVGE